MPASSPQCTVNPKNNKGETPLALSVKNKHFEILNASFKQKINEKKRKEPGISLQPNKKSKDDGEI